MKQSRFTSISVTKPLKHQVKILAANLDLTYDEFLTNLVGMYTNMLTLTVNKNIITKFNSCTTKTLYEAVTELIKEGKIQEVEA